MCSDDDKDVPPSGDVAGLTFEDIGLCFFALPQQNTMTSKPDNVLLTWLLLFLLRLQAKHYTPDSAVNCLLKFLYFLQHHWPPQ